MFGLESLWDVTSKYEIYEIEAFSAFSKSFPEPVPCSVCVSQGTNYANFELETLKLYVSLKVVPFLRHHPFSRHYSEEGDLAKTD